MIHRIFIYALLIVVLALALAPSPSHGQGIKGREILGLRFGAVLSSGALNDKFGDGSEIEIHFIEGLRSWLGISVALSSHNFGESRERDTYNRPYDLQIFSVTAAVIAFAQVGRRLSPTIEGGCGLYTTNVVVQAGLYEGTITDNQFGIYGGGGLFYRITKSLFINANAKYHYIFSGDDLQGTEYSYTSGNRTAIYQIAVGISLYTG
jgi:hypothetical protein